MFVLPLDTVTSSLNKAVNLASEIRPAAMDAMNGFMEIGTGIGSIFILFVIFSYIVSLLEGGKFQVKMLWPLVLYVFVASFSSTVAPATLSFTSAIRRGLTEKAEQAKNKTFSGITGGESATLLDVIMCSAFPAQEAAVGKSVEQFIFESVYPDGTYETGYNSDGEFTVTTSTGQTGDSWKDKIKNFGEDIAAQIRTAWLNIKIEALRGIYNPPASVASNWVIHFVGNFITFCLCALLDLIVTAMTVVMVCYGIISTYLLIAFGPVTWSFAIFPGNGKILGSWFMRLAQFTLYGPIAMVIRTFCYATAAAMTRTYHAFATPDTSALSTISGGLAHNFDGFSFVLFLVLAVCCLIALLNVPTLASFALEGASGAVSMMAAGNTLIGLGNLNKNSRQLSNQEQMKEQMGIGKGSRGGGSGESSAGNKSGPNRI